jgi:hypothetical protein
MIASPETKAIAPSEIAVLMKVQRIRLTARKGRNSWTGLSKIKLKTKPVVNT